MSNFAPGVRTKETDLTLTTQSIGGVAGATVGSFLWGPVNEPVFITNGEKELLSRFMYPDDQTAVSFLSIANFLLYVNACFVTRIVGPNATNAVPVGETPVTVYNDDHAEEVTLTGISFLGRYPGAMMNGVTVSLMGNTSYATWPYRNEFAYSPTQANEFNLVVVDSAGSITGTPGTVIERFELVSIIPTAKKFDGSTAYFVNVINRSSEYIRVGDPSEVVNIGAGMDVILQGGIDHNIRTDLDYKSGFDVYEDTSSYDITAFFAADSDATGSQRMIDIAEIRGDAIAFISPMISDVVPKSSNNMTNVITYRSDVINKNSSYAFCDDNWKLVYDKYNDVQRWIPCNSDSAGLFCRVHVTDQPWFSPAGYNRGQLKNVIKLAWVATEAQRKTLYDAQVNSIITERGEGTILMGDKTMLTRPSNFSRINVRSLFIVLKKAIANSAKYRLFEQNDPLTRSLFRNSTNSYLDTVVAGRGIEENGYYVKCDEENNNEQVRMENRFVGSIFIKPVHSINYIELNFVNTPAGVDFSEIENSF